MKREESGLASSSQMKAKAVGCMSALFHFLNSRKFKLLTLGKSEEEKKEIRSGGGKRNKKKRRSDRDESPARSPGLPTELRRSDPAPTTEEKRRVLVEALERCDRDLKALKSIIQAVRSGSGSGEDIDNGRSDVGDEPSPVCVLLNNFLASPSPFAPRSLPYGHEKKHQQSIVNQEKKTNTIIFDQITCELFQTKSRVMTSKISLQSTKEVVEELFRDMARGQRREIGRIGFALQDHIFRDMVEEIVVEFGYSFNVHRKLYSLPFEACKRRLSF